MLRRMRMAGGWFGASAAGSEQHPNGDRAKASRRRWWVVASIAWRPATTRCTAGSLCVAYAATGRDIDLLSVAGGARLGIPH